MFRAGEQERKGDCKGKIVWSETVPLTHVCVFVCFILFFFIPCYVVIAVDPVICVHHLIVFVAFVVVIYCMFH